MSEDCKNMQDKIVDCIFRALSQEDCDALNEHVATCSKCAEYMRVLRDERSLFRDFAEKVDTGMGARQERMAKAVERCNPSKRTKLPLTWRTIAQSRITKLAVAAAALIAVGFFAGRLLSAQPVNVQQLQAALETSLKSSLEVAIRQSLLEQANRDREQALERHYVRLRDELTRQFRHDLNEFAVRTLAASQEVTDRRLAELIRLIEAARTVDHLQVAMALEQVESNRLEDKTRLGQGLASLAAQKNTVLPNNQQ